MKTKRKLLYAALLIIVLSSFFACDNNDGYSLNDFRISIASVVPEAGQSYSLLLDNGKKLWPAASDIHYRPSANQRVFVNYTILSDKMDGFDHYIKVNDIWNVLTKPVIELTEQNKDSIGNDPVRMNEIWIGDHYLNTGFSFNYNGMKPHAINLVRNKTITTEEEEDADLIELEFKHNSYNSTSNSLVNGFACFDLRPFQREDKNSILIKVLVKDWDGEKEYELTYNYNDMSKDKTESVTPNITSNEYK